MVKGKLREAKRKQLQNDERQVDSRDDSTVSSPTPPAAKRLKQASKRTPCLLSDFGPEILSNIFSFLTLKEGLEVPRTCWRIHNDNMANLVFRYCYILEFSDDADDDELCSELYFLTSIQGRILCNPVSLDNLRAVLRNETLPEKFLQTFIGRMATTIKTDNSQAMSVLVNDGRCQPDIEDLDVLLKKDFTNMAAVLMEHDKVKKDIQICALCKDNVGCYDCGNYNSDAPPACIVQSSKERYCRQCVLNDGNNRFCLSCEDFVCPECVRHGHFRSCGNVKCDYMTCFHPDCDLEWMQCCDCDRRLCFRCDAPQTGWKHIEDHPGYLCPSCPPAGRMVIYTCT